MSSCEKDVIDEKCSFLCVVMLQKKVPKVLTQCRKLGLTGKAIVSQNEFITRWTTFTNGILNGLDWTNVFCAGGAILGNLVADNAGYTTSDIDLFLYGLDTDETANAKLREIHAMIVRNTGCQGDVIRTARAVTILNTHPYRHVQVVLRAYKSPAEVLLGFDIDSCTVGFDGKNIYCMERFKRALTKGYNLVNISRRSLTYEQRLYKYSRRGFAVAVPNLDKSRVNPEIFTKRIKELYGLSKLLLYDHLSQLQLNRSRSAGNGGGKNTDFRIQSQESSDYNGELEIPWGPNFTSKSIMHILRIKDKRQFFGQIQKMKQEQRKGVLQQQPTKKAEHLFETIFFDITGSDGSKQPKIEWIRNNPAYQDLDGGFARPLMTGSFQLPPPVQAVWDLNSYSTNQTNVRGMSEDQGYVPGEWSAQPSQVASKFVDSSSSSPSKIKSPKKPSSPSSSFGKPTTGGFMTDTGVASTGGGIFATSTAGGHFDLSAFGGPSQQPDTSFGDSTLSSSTSASAAGGFFVPQKFTVAAKKGKREKSEESPASSSAAPSAFGMGARPGPSPSNATTFAPSAVPMALHPSSMDALVREIAGLKVFIQSALKNQSTLQHPTGQEEAPPTTKLLLLVSLCYKQGSITSDEKSTLKDLIIDRNEAIFGALEVFEVDQDLEELVDTFKHLIKAKRSSSSS